MQGRDLRGSEEQGVTFVELFFDLVFVFAVTQVTAVLAHDLTAAGVMRALIVFWLVWWAWTQFTWSLNEADTEHATVRLLTLVATAIAFLMAVTVPLVTEPLGWMFPLSYLVVRVIGISLQGMLVGGNAIQRKAVLSWSLMSSLGLGAVAAAIFLPGDLRYPALAVAAALDVAAALRAGRNEWHLFAGHFSERHGLFVIIALGESLIAAGVTVGEAPDGIVLAAAVAAVVTTCALWWTYFGWVKHALEEGMTRQRVGDVGRYARNVYSFAHFPMIFGVIGFAVGIEESIAHPRDPLEAAGVTALVGGVILIVGGTALAAWLAVRRLPRIRLFAMAVIAALVPVLGAVPAAIALAMMGAVIVALAVVERSPIRASMPESRPRP